MEHPKLRDSKKLLTREPYPINEIPDSVIRLIERNLFICFVLVTQI